MRGHCRRAARAPARAPRYHFFQTNRNLAFFFYRPPSYTAQYGSPALTFYNVTPSGRRGVSRRPCQLARGPTLKRPICSRRARPSPRGPV
ncbi:hypothetical protein EVAR_5660_1 [Eumeta japonica]|uniref:Uncharacterized protein n=1 Tax=Eumeta variegata TaxID=151549 RepID=A0A4C1T846_EUMVA|nr:hypothetical protein EVAR_5660_1 [Eumeta japonica]